MATQEKTEVAVKGAKPPEKAVSRTMSPFEEFERFFDQIAPRMWLRSMRWPRGLQLEAEEMQKWAPSVDVIEREKEIVVKAEVPGVQKEDVHVSLSGNLMTIKGETRREEKEEKGDYYHCEISRGAFSRMVTLPADVDEKNAKAELRDGMLVVTVPKLEQPKKTDIEIQ
jgi:HSP20 family protein